MADELSLRIRVLNATRAGFRSALGALRSFGRGARTIASGIGNVFRTMSRIIVVAATAIVGATAFAIRAFIKQQDAEVRLAAVTKATGNASGYTAKQLRQQASDLQRVTKYGDEAIIGTQAILATFKEIKGDQFKQATEAILDMSTVLGQDAKQGAIQLGKALNDPTKGITALSRVGVSFTKEQLKQVKALQKSGDMAGAQAVILKELQSEFGGAARAARDTLGGSLIALKNSLGDTAEAIGGTFDKTFGLREIFENLRIKIENFTESSTLQIWANKTKKAFDELLTVIEALFAGGEERQIVIEGLKQAGASIGQSIVAFLLRWGAVIGDMMGRGLKAALIEFPSKARAHREYAIETLADEYTRGPQGQEGTKREKKLATKILKETEMGQFAIAQRENEIRRALLLQKGMTAAAGVAGGTPDEIWQSILTQLEQVNTNITGLKQQNPQ